MPKSKSKKASPKHFPSKPYMRALHTAPPTAAPPTAAWSTTDDELLLTSKTSGKKWVEISPLFPGKTSNACRKRHARLVTNAQLEWNAEREKDLAMEFANAKVAFFKSLAGNLGLEWQQVEKKCVEMGFRALLEKGKKCSPTAPPPPHSRTHNPQSNRKRRVTDDTGEDSPATENTQSPAPAAAAVPVPAPVRPRAKRIGKPPKTKKPPAAAAAAVGGGGGGRGEIVVEVPVGMELEVREDPADAGDELEDDDEEKKRLDTTLE
ncbi:unnamed protein product [Tuber aestivum]|uniref:Myb-like domain-containing protein n=1 Tax=Tuber aestivum TaxID=59557 RepID=A0A292PME0_9PEZI|nr:unnamed protein product [Tuber aestivum]